MFSYHSFSYSMQFSRNRIFHDIYEIVFAFSPYYTEGIIKSHFVNPWGTIIAGISYRQEWWIISLIKSGCKSWLFCMWHKTWVSRISRTKTRPMVVGLTHLRKTLDIDSGWIFITNFYWWYQFYSMCVPNTYFSSVHYYELVE